MERYIRKINTFCLFAHHLAELSTCKRQVVGVIIFDFACTRIFAIGFNGPAAKRPNDSCTGEMGNCGCAHAEVNAIAKLNPEVGPVLMYSTVLPCFNCCNAIINSGAIHSVIYNETCRHERAESFLKEVGIHCVKTETKEYNDLLSEWRMLGTRTR